MRGCRKNSLRLFFLLISSVLSRPLLAAESHGHFDLSAFIGQVVNFVILFGGLAFLLRKPLNEYLKGKAEQVATLLQQTEALKLESARKLEQTRARLDGLAAEISALKAQAEKESAREKELILQEAEKEAQRLRNLAREEIESLLRVCIRELKAYAIELSVAKAEERIKKKLTPELHRKLIHKAIDRLRSTNEPSVDS